MPIPFYFCLVVLSLTNNQQCIIVCVKSQSKVRNCRSELFADKCFGSLLFSTGFKAVVGRYILIVNGPKYPVHGNSNGETRGRNKIIVKE